MLPFGLRSAPNIFTAVAYMIAWVFYRAGIEDQLHYLDDILFFSLPPTASATNLSQSAVAMLEYLGFPVARKKVEGTACQVTFLGVVIDTVVFELHLPHEKIVQLQDLLWVWTSSKARTRKKLESLLWCLSRVASSCALDFASFLLCCRNQRPPITLFYCRQGLREQSRKCNHIVRDNAPVASLTAPRT